MLTIKDLGRKLRKENPKKFAHLTDEQIGRAAKRAAESKGSHEYDNYLDTGIVHQPRSSSAVQDKNHTFNTLSKDLLGKSESLLNPNDLGKKVEALLGTLDPRDGWFGNWIKSKSTARQLETATNLTKIENEVI
jgi:hypothetical protein